MPRARKSAKVPKRKMKNRVGTATRVIGAAAGMAASRFARKSTRTVTQTRRKYNRTQGSGTQDYTRTQVQYGRRPRLTLRNVARELRANKELSYFQINRTSAFGGLSGRDSLTNYQSALGQLLYAPVHVLDITACPNVINTVATTPVNHWTLGFSTEVATHGAQWIVNADRSWALRDATQASNIVSDYPGGNSILNWFSAKMIFYAPTTIPIKVVVQLVQLRWDALHPPAAGGLVTDIGHTAFWETMAKPYMWSPIETTSASHMKYMKVLMSRTMYLDPKETSDQNATRYKQLDLFAKLYRRCNYRWSKTDRQSMIAADEHRNLDESNTYTVQPRARIYMIVRATAGRQLGGAAYNTAIHPSYDMMATVCHSQMSG